MPAAGVAGAALTRLAARLFGCRHRKISRAYSGRDQNGVSVYWVVCLDACKRKLRYDWERMECGEPFDE